MKSLSWKAVRENTARMGGFAFATASSFAVFSYTLCPTVYAGDSGELALAAYSLGIGHPPGYPLFVLIGRVFSTFPSGEPAYMTNLLSALFASLSVGLVFLLLERVAGRTHVSVAGALVLAFSLSFWSQATITEVYSFLCLGTAALLLCMEAMERRGLAGHAYLLSYLSGLSLVLHQSMIFFLPASLYMIAKKRNRARVAHLVLLFILGVSPYFVLLVRSRFDPLIDWGDPEGMGAFLDLLLRRDYGTLRQNAISPEIFLANVQGFFLLLLKEYPLGVLLFGLFGIACLDRKRRVFSRAVFIFFSSFLLGMIFLINPYPDAVHLYQFSLLYMPLYLVAGVWIGLGFHEVLSFLLARRGLRKAAFFAGEVRAHHWAGKTLWGADAVDTGRIASGFLTLVFFAIPVWMGLGNLPKCNKRSFFDARVYGENILRSIPAGGVLFVDGDNETFLVAYLTRVLGLRPDLQVYHKKGYIFPAGPGRSSLSVGSSPPGGGSGPEGGKPVYFATYVDPSSLGLQRLEREGIVFRAVSEDSGKDRAQGSARDRALLVSCDMGILEREPEALDFLVRKFAIGYLQSLWAYEKKVGNEKAADRILGSISRMGHDFAEAHYLIGREMEGRGDYRRAYKSYLMSAHLDPKAPFPWQGLERVRKKILGSGGRAGNGN